MGDQSQADLEGCRSGLPDIYMLLLADALQDLVELMGERLGGTRCPTGSVTCSQRRRYALTTAEYQTCSDVTREDLVSAGTSSEPASRKHEQASVVADRKFPRQIGCKAYQG